MVTVPASSAFKAVIVPVPIETPLIGSNRDTFIAVMAIMAFIGSLPGVACEDVMAFRAGSAVEGLPLSLAASWAAHP